MHTETYVHLKQWKVVLFLGINAASGPNTTQWLKKKGEWAKMRSIESVTVVIVFPPDLKL